MEDMKQIHDFAAKRSDKLRDRNTNCTVVPFPEFAALKAEVEKLRVEISMLLLERDELRFVICKNIETAYMLALGSLEYKAFELNCNVLRIKRKIDRKRLRYQPLINCLIKSLPVFSVSSMSRSIR